MDIRPLALDGLYEIQPRRFGDSRGYFSETFKRDVLRESGIDFEPIQDNESLSTRLGTLRGLHFQAPPQAQAKLVRCGRGALFDVAVDIRQGSPSYGQWTGALLSEHNGRQLLVPAGFAHGFATLVPNTEIVYKCSAPYAPETEGAVRWDDPDIGIHWGVEGDPILSEKDTLAPRLADLDSPFRYEV